MHPSLHWYVQRHKAKMDDTLDKFKLSKPAKDFKEKMNNVKGGALNTFNKVGAGVFIPI